MIFRSWGEAENDCIISRNNNNNNKLGISSAIKMKKIKAGGGGRRKVREPRFCFKTLSADVDVLDDGYKWRKYGQKVVKNTLHPRYLPTLLFMHASTLCVCVCVYAINLYH